MANKFLKKVFNFEIIGDFLLQFTDTDNLNRETQIFSIAITTVARVSINRSIITGTIGSLVIEFKDEIFDSIRINYNNNDEQALMDYQSILNLMIINRLK